MAAPLSTRLILPGLLGLGLWLGGCAHQPATGPSAHPPSSTEPASPQRAPASGPRRYVLNKTLDLIPG